jgi:BNR/Asp-box repeat
MKNIILFLVILLFLNSGCSVNPTEEIIPSNISITWEKLPFSTGEDPGYGSLAGMLISSENKIFGIVNRTFCKSSDLGKTWQTIKFPEQSYADGFYIDRYDNIYAYEFLGPLFRSKDDGENWEKLGGHFNWMFDLYSTSDNAIFVSTIISDMFPLAYNRKIEKSADNGKTWNTIFTCDGFVIDKYDNLFSWRGDSLLVSNNSGDLWTLLHEFSDPIFDMKSDKNGILFMSKGYSGSQLNLYKSQDQGLTWNELPSVSDNFTFWISNNDLFLRSYQDTFYKYKNSSNSWEQLAITFEVNEIGAINSNIIVASKNNGIYLSENDGKNWQNYSISIPPFKFLVSSNNRFVTADFVSDDLEIWKWSDGLSDNYLHDMIVNSNGDIFILSSGKKLFVSWDNGDTYKANSMVGLGGGFQVEQIISTEDNTLFLSKSHDGIYKSEDNGLSWVKVLESNEWNSFFVNNRDVLCVGTWDKLYVSKDKGINWNIVIDNISISFLNISCQNEIYLKSNVGFQISNDFGLSWNNLDWDFEEIYISDNNEIFIGVNSYSSFYSTDQGATWNEIEILNNVKVESVLIDEIQEIVLLGTDKNGIIKGKIN